MYVRVKDNKVVEYPCDVNSLYRHFPNSSFPVDVGNHPSVLSDFGVYAVQLLPKPTFNAQEEKLVPGIPETKDGIWVQPWYVVELTVEEKEQKRKQIQTDIEARVRMSLEAFVQQRGYDNVTSAVSYANSTNTKYAEEAARVIELRDNTWSALFQIFEDVELGVRPPVLSYDEIVDELPLLAW